ncbi:NAD-dependent deacetylase [Thermanaeromonas toyohensis ToBE]|uniref:protein acetyllysine N-acetyltransferase n=1 Tax=Thermanaeromonas toyohensis ToBE TaxID=698762 RepID=A0A1W1VEV0_9FIRM|nr:NAD-dependent deacylase [Thermanaeromonas toyohensis]SMB91750.1 NAD-dependent deacetylase [Thermanaeromonas toyohensis ToBE]
MEDLFEAVAKVNQILKRSRKTLVLTGAGASTESGIPDYRSKGTGLWQKFDPMEKASITALLTNPEEFYRFNLPRWSKYIQAEPNVTHRALARLEENGLIYGVITQNIDGLHQKAGSKRVWEVHGHLRTCHCLECGTSYPFTELIGQFNQGINPPNCPQCRGILRPDVVLFEDPMSQDYYSALEEMKDCETLMVVGSSLQVYPVAELPRLAPKLIIINKEPTPWDFKAIIVVHEQAGKFFEKFI